MAPYSKSSMRINLKKNGGRRKPWALLLLLAFFLCPVLLACSLGSPAGYVKAGSPGDNARIIRDVPFFPQEKYQCGPAALASVLNYRGLKVTPGEIAPAIYSESARGTLNIDMVFYAERQGMKASQYSGTLDDLKKNLDRSNPLIVLVDYGFLSYRKDHFMVVVGYDAGHIIAHSGRDSFKPVPIDDFLKTWKKTKNWTLLIEETRRVP